MQAGIDLSVKTRHGCVGAMLWLLLPLKTGSCLAAASVSKCC
jgi:hypothetical protein